MRRKIVILIIMTAVMLSACTVNSNPYSPSPTPIVGGVAPLVTSVAAVNEVAELDEEPQSMSAVTDDNLIGADNGLEVYFVDAYIGEDNKEYYEILIYNNSESILRADCISIAINSVSVLPYLSEAIEAGEYLLYRNSISSQQTGFMQDYCEVVSIQAEIYGISYIDNSVVAVVNDCLVLDESIELHKPDFTGQIIYNQDDFIMGIDKIVDGDNITNFVIYYENNSDTTLAIPITKITVGPYEIPDRTFLTAAHNSYFAWVIDMDTTIPNEEYEVTIEYRIIDDIMTEVEGLEHETLTFTLK